MSMRSIQKILIASLICHLEKVQDFVSGGNDYGLT
jgi:hypothetical protein